MWHPLHWIGTYTQIEAFLCVLELGFSRISPQNQSPNVPTIFLKTKRTLRFFITFCQPQVKHIKYFCRGFGIHLSAKIPAKETKSCSCFRSSSNFNATKTHMHTHRHISRSFLNKNYLGHLTWMNFWKCPPFFWKNVGANAVERPIGRS